MFWRIPTDLSFFQILRNSIPGVNNNALLFYMQFVNLLENDEYHMIGEQKKK